MQCQFFSELDRGPINVPQIWNYWICPINIQQIWNAIGSQKQIHLIFASLKPTWTFTSLPSCWRGVWNLVCLLDDCVEASFISSHITVPWWKPSHSRACVPVWNSIHPEAPGAPSMAMPLVISPRASLSRNNPSRTLVIWTGITTPGPPTTLLLLLPKVVTCATAPRRAMMTILLFLLWMRYQT